MVVHVDVVGVFAVGVGHVHGCSVRECDVVHGRVVVVVKLLANETLVKDCFVRRKAVVGARCVNGVVVVRDCAAKMPHPLWVGGIAFPSFRWSVINVKSRREKRRAGCAYLRCAC